MATIATVNNYRITRTGRAKKQGGQGIKWSCSCSYKQGPCFHLLAVWHAATGAKSKLAKQMVLTVAGKRLLKGRA